MSRVWNPRYSPRNWLIVDWSENGRPFDDCGLPPPECPEDEPPGEPECLAIPIAEAIDTYDWYRFLPEVMVGIEDPDEEIAANYVREAAIEFAKQTRVLQREIYLPLQQDAQTYPLFPYPEEQIVGILGMKTEGCGPCGCTSKTSGVFQGAPWTFDPARNEITFASTPGCRAIQILVWAAPTEAACVYDKFLYDEYRQDITTGARTRYAMALHFRDRALVASLSSPEEFLRRMLVARRNATRKPASWPTQGGSALFGGRGCCYPERERYFGYGG